MVGPGLVKNIAKSVGAKGITAVSSLDPKAIAVSQATVLVYHFAHVASRKLAEAAVRRLNKL